MLICGQAEVSIAEKRAWGSGKEEREDGRAPEVILTSAWRRGFEIVAGRARLATFLRIRTNYYL